MADYDPDSSERKLTAISIDYAVATAIAVFGLSKPEASAFERYLVMNADVPLSLRPTKTPRTHYDAIRDMSVEELAAWLAENAGGCDDWCMHYRTEFCDKHEYGCIDTWLDWLKQEVVE